MVLPLNEVALDVLRRRGLGSTIGFAFPGEEPRTYRSRPNHELVKVGKDAGLGEGLKLHDCRRTVRQRLLDLGVPPHTVHAALGHAADKLTQTYMPEGVPQSVLRDAFDKWGEALADVLQGNPEVKNTGVGARAVGGPIL